MPRLNQGGRVPVGARYRTSSASVDEIKPMRTTGRFHAVMTSHGRPVMAIADDLKEEGVSMYGTGLSLPGGGLSLPGGGVFDVVRKISSFLPSSDANARPGFPGEQHAVLMLPNGRTGVANYMGPGTQLEKRLHRGDPPRTMEDRVAQAHDIRYGLAKSQADVSAADRKMIAKLKDMKAKKQGNRFNIELGLRPIQAKLAAESMGIVKPGKIASFGDTKEPALLSGKLSELEQEGFGHPGDALRSKVVKSMMKGRGKAADSVKRLANFAAKTLVPQLLDEINDMLNPERAQKGSGLKLAGMGLPDIKSKIHMSMLSALNDGASRSKTQADSKGYMTGTGVGDIFKKLKPMAMGAAKAIMPLVLSLLMGKLKGQGGGAYDNLTLDQLRAHNAKSPGLLAHLGKALFKGFKWFLSTGMPKSGQAGRGFAEMSGMGFWDGFKKGFMKVWSPILSVGKAVAPIASLLL